MHLPTVWKFFAMNCLSEGVGLITAYSWLSRITKNSASQKTAGVIISLMHPYNIIQDYQQKYEVNSK